MEILNKIVFEDLPSEETPLEADALNGMQDNTNLALNEVLNLVYPIGRGFIDFTNTDFSNYLGFTWERELVGLTPVGYNARDIDFNEIGKTGGEKTHTLTIDELPWHNHVTRIGWSDVPQRDSIIPTWGDGQLTIDRNDTTTSGTGNNQAHNIMQPYKVVAYWKRVA